MILMKSADAHFISGLDNGVVCVLLTVDVWISSSAGDSREYRHCLYLSDPVTTFISIYSRCVYVLTPIQSVATDSIQRQ